MGIQPFLPNVFADGGRPEVIAVANSAVARYAANESETGIEVPPRVGKSAIARIIALECSALGAPYVLHVVPWVNLTEQILDDAKTADFKRFYGVSAPLLRDSVESIKHHQFFERRKGTPTLLTATLGLIHHKSNLENVIDSISYGIDKTGKRPVIILDEVHLVHWTKALGATVARLMKSGAYVVSMTGTPVRADKGLIPGFSFSEVDGSRTEAVRTVRCKGRYVDDDGQKMMIMSKGEKTSADFVMTPIGSEPVPWRTAFDKGWLMKCNFIKLDFQIPSLGCMLSEASKKEIRLSEIVKMEECINVGTEAMLRRLASKRIATGQNVQALVITGTDEGFDDRDGANHHARDIRRAINEQIAILPDIERNALKNLTIKIATSVANDGSPDTGKSADRIKDFVGGKIDILIVKMMALVGLDAPGCKVNLFLSPIRKGPLMSQASTRQLTPGEGFNFAGDLIIPWESGAQELSDEFVLAGGAMKIESYVEQTVEEIPCEEEPRDELTLTNGEVSGYADQDGNQYIGNYEALLLAIKVRYSRLVANLTDPVILEGYKSGAFPVNDSEIASVTPSVDAGTENLRGRRKKSHGKIAERAQKIASKHFHYPTQTEAWRALQSKLINKAKIYARVSTTTTVGDIDDPDVIESILEALEVVDAHALKEEILRKAA